MLTRPAAVLLTLPLLFAACHQPRPGDPTGADSSSRRAPAAPATPAPTPVPTPVPTPFPPPQLDSAGLDIGPTDAWYSRNSARIQLDPNGSAEDLALVLNLIRWVVDNDESAWNKASGRIEQASLEGAPALKLPVLPGNVEEAKKYHQAVAALSGKGEKERDPAAEDAYYRKAVVLSPGDADLWNHLAVTSSLRKDYRSAEHYAKTAIAVDPTFLSAYQELSYAYKNSERYAEAVAVAERGLKLDGDLHTKSVLLARQGQAYWMMNEKDKALGAFARSKRLGGPPWIDSYLDGKQVLGKTYQTEAPPAAGSASPAPGEPSPSPVKVP